MSKETKIKGTIKSVRIHKDDGWSVITILDEKTNRSMTVTGKMSAPQEGLTVECSGYIKERQNKYTGKMEKQLAANSIQESTPTTEKGIRLFLASDLIQGIGKGYADKIVDKFGDKTLDVIRNKPWLLKQVKGLGQKRIDSLVAGFNDQDNIAEIMTFLRDIDVGHADAIKVFKNHGHDAINAIKHNPYTLCDIKGIGFKKSDVVAKSLNISGDDPERIKAGIMHTLEEASDEGHTCEFSQKLAEKVHILLNNENGSCPKVKIEDQIQSLIKDKKVISEEYQEQERIYSKKMYYSEISISRNISRLQNADPKWANRKIHINNDTYSDEQKQAVENVFSSNVSILTGGPGVGKTTVIREIVQQAQKMGANVVQFAPTGRAAKRMSESTGLKSKTIHRGLGVAGDHGGFKHNEANPLEGDLFIIDESSMLDTQLTDSLMSAIPTGSAVILVGDVNQLPSVGAGNVLNDLIESDAVPVSKLTKIFRQAEGSHIITNSHKINEGIMPDLTNGERKDKEGNSYWEPTDFNYAPFEREKDEENNERLNNEIANSIVEFVSEKIPDRLGIDNSDIQVLTPMRGGQLGTVELNKKIQEKVNPKKPHDHVITRTDGNTLVEYRKGDRIIQTKNNYDLHVFNGDTGTILNVNKKDESITADFDGKEVVMKGGDINAINLAYAITIHKSQGSQYKAVVIPCAMSHFKMLERRLLYTAVTRGEERVLVAGQKRAIKLSIDENKIIARNTGLKERIKESQEYKRDIQEQKNLRAKEKQQMSFF